MPEPVTTDPTAEEPKPSKPLEDQQFTTRHAITIGAERIDYTAKVGRVVLHDDAEESTPKVGIFYTAYFRDEDTPRRNRPLVFLWNGGPGSSTVWLHLFSLGPRRIEFEGDPRYDTSRWQLGENQHSLLDVADLVFVDAPSTGFSRMAPGEELTQFHGIDADAAVFGDFVAEFVARERRGDSPLVLLGESYGTIRTPVVAEHLLNKHGISLDGIVLVSSVMDVASVNFGVGNNLGAVGLLPAYTATALYHGRISGDFDALIAEAENFAVNEYSVALLRGSRLSHREQERIANRVAELSGLASDVVLRSNLRVTLWRYVRELLRDRRRIVGRLDSRLTGATSEAAGDLFENDPSLSMITGPASRAMNLHIREDLGWEADPGLSYRMLNPLPNWKPRASQQVGIWTPQVEVASVLHGVLNRTPQLKVMLQSGYYDLATPYFPAEMTFDQLHLDPSVAANVSTKRYDAGHMMYLHDPSLEDMRTDLGAFLATLRTGGVV